MNDSQHEHPFRRDLEHALSDQRDIWVYVPSGHFQGTVVALDAETVELRSQARRCVVRTDRIDAIVRE